MLLGIAMVDKARILLIDDDENIRSTLSLTLELEGFIVDQAENGTEAIAKSFSNFYNLVIVDGVFQILKEPNS